MTTICLSGAIVLRAGANHPTLTEGNYIALISGAAAFVSTSARYDYVTNFGSCSAIGQEIIKEAVACYAAIGLINYDMSGYTSRTEAQTMLNVNWNKMVECINLLRDDNFRIFILQGS
jgi:hypothetical protein